MLFTGAVVAYEVHLVHGTLGVVMCGMGPSLVSFFFCFFFSVVGPENVCAVFGFEFLNSMEIIKSERGKRWLEESNNCKKTRFFCCCYSFFAIKKKADVTYEKKKRVRIIIIIISTHTTLQ